MHRFECVWN